MSLWSVDFSLSDCDDFDILRSIVESNEYTTCMQQLNDTLFDSAVLKTFDELTIHELYELLRLRVDVFVVEQHCPYPELDGEDTKALHVLFYNAGQLDGYARVFLPEHGSTTGRIGRIIVRASARGRGLGKEVVDQSLNVLRTKSDANVCEISAQEHLQTMYARSGFSTYTEMYLEDGIPHVGMRMEV